MVKIAYFSESMEIPSGVKVKIEGNNLITITGPNGGPITKDFSHARGIKIAIEKNKINFNSYFPKKNTVALAKTIINIINNLIVGVQTNYKYVCKVCYSHFPCSVKVDEEKKMLYVENFLGERAPRKTKYVENVNIKVDGDDVYLIGPDKEVLGQTAANLKRCCKIRKKDPRVFQDGVYLFKKQIGENIIWQIK
jgi:large subunit ribosomal protein L6